MESSSLMKKDPAKKKRQPSQSKDKDKPVEEGVRSYNLDMKVPLDLKTGFNTFCNNKEMYYNLLPNFEDSGFLENLFYLAYGVQVGNFKVMMDKAHSIKGSAAYAGASRISNDGYWIQVYFEKQEYVNMMKHYVSLLEHSAQFRIYWRKVYHEYKKTPYVPKPEDEEIPLPVGYTLTKVGVYDFKCTYPDDYLDLAIEAELRGK